MSYYVLSGQRMNALKTAVATPVMSPVAAALFPATNADNGLDGDLPAVTWFGSVGTDGTYSCDINEVTNPSALVDTSGWTITGTVIRDTTFKPAGATASFKITGTTGVLSQNVTARSGDLKKIMWSDAGDGVTGQLRLRVQNLQTGKYLDSTGAWQAAVTDLDTRTINSFLAGSRTFTVEPFLTTLVDVCTLQITARCTAAGNAWIGDIVLFSALDFCGFFGHNIDPVIVPKFESSDDNAAWTTQATMVVAQPTFYSLLGAVVNARYWRVKFVGTPQSAIWFGPLVWGQTLIGQRNPNWGMQTEFIEDQARTETPAHFTTVFNRQQKYPRRRVTFPFDYRNLAQYQQARDLIVMRSRGGAYPVVVISTDSDTEVCLLGRLPAAWSQKNSFTNMRQGEIVVEEDGFPIATP